MSLSRGDAPVDGQILLDGSAAQEAVLQVAGSPDVRLSIEVLVQSRSTPRSVILPPHGGWPVGVQLVVGPVDGNLQVVDTLTFEASAAPAPDPVQTGVFTWTMGPWEPDREYTWGCCTHVRNVTIDVAMPTVDSWSTVEFAGVFQFDVPMEEVTPLDVRLSTPTVQFQAIQWIEEDGSVEPPCFELTHRSASGVRGPVERLCIDDGLEPVEDVELPTVPNGCSTASATTSWVSWIGRRR